MKIIVTTSDLYLHLLPVFCYLFNKHWGGPVEIVGYKAPENLPDNFSFHSMGVQGDKKEFSTDLRKYFENQDSWFMWLMEDTFIKWRVDPKKINKLASLCSDGVGRINLTGECVKQKNRFYDIIEDYIIYENTQDAKYRLSTQPSIWNKEFLLKYMTPGLSPWDFETQPSVNDGYKILGPAMPAVMHNEGVRRFDLHNLNLDGIDIQEIKAFI